MNIRVRLDDLLILEDGSEVRYDPEKWPTTEAEGPLDKTKCYWNGKVPLAKTHYMLIKELKDAKALELHLACEYEMTERNQGIESVNINAKIDCREIDVLRVDQLLDMLIADGATEDTELGYICYDNSIKKSKVKKVRAGKYELTKKLMEMLYHKHKLYDDVDSAQTEEDIAKIKWKWKNDTV